jgi:hypothetical protein
MTYFYTKFVGNYLPLGNQVRPYDVTGVLDHIDYGTRAGSEGVGNAPAQVWFTKADRCINSCVRNTVDFPDTPAPTGHNTPDSKDHPQPAAARPNPNPPLP